MKKRLTKSEKKELNHQSRRTSIKEGIFATFRVSFFDHYISPFAIAINSSNAMISMIHAVIGLLGPLTQLSGSKLIEKYSRKKIVLKSVFWESFSLIPLMIIAFLFLQGILTSLLPVLFLIFLSIFIIIANLPLPAWFSWMGDIVDENFRGRWFSKRHLVIGVMAGILTTSSAFLLDTFKKNNLIMQGFILFFFLAFIGRLVSAYFLKKQYEPKIQLKKTDYFSFTDFVINARRNNFGRFTIFRTALAFACSISSPLIAVYLLRNLGFNYLIYTIIIFFGTGISMFVLKIWGKFADKYGNYRVFLLTTILIPIIPILWILNTNPIYLMLVPSAIGGVCWAGFNLSAGNFIYDNVPSHKRGFAVSYYNLLVGIGVFLGAGLGAILIKFVKTPLIEPLVIIFIIGAIFRMIAVFFFIPTIREVRKTKKFSLIGALKHLKFKDVGKTLSEDVHEMVSIKDYFFDHPKTFKQK